MSGWENVLSGVPQGSVLGPVLFTLFVNDLDENLTNILLKFADDSKMVGRVKTEDDVMSIRNDLMKIAKWCNDWCMLLNIEKCKVMHFGYHNKCVTYELDDTILEHVNVEKDLGVLVSSDMKVSAQCSSVTKMQTKL